MSHRKSTNGHSFNLTQARGWRRVGETGATRGISLRGSRAWGRDPVPVSGGRGSLPSSAPGTGSRDSADRAGESEVPAAGGDAAPAAPVTEARVPTWKRSLDIALIAGSSFLWLPVLIVVGLWVRLVSRGPVFFRQVRVGAGGLPFTMLKFRSMKVDADTTSHEAHVANLIKSDVPMTKLDVIGDPRLIPGGFLIRSFGLDELPQLINVLRGEMSLVGPRPCTTVEFSQFTPDQCERFAALPGLTGYWQVSGKNRTTFSKMVERDIEYARCQAPLLDLAIIAATIPALLLQFAESRSGIIQLRKDAECERDGAAPSGERDATDPASNGGDATVRPETSGSGVR